MKGFFSGTAMVALLLVLAGCKIGAAAFQGGDVISSSGSRHCLEGKTCEFDIDDPYFTETFTATPRDGYTFTRWKGGSGFLCPDSTDPVCSYTLVGDDIADAVVASNSGIVYLIPEFACPSGDCAPAHLLQDAIDALEDARVTLEEYVAFHGTGADNPLLYGIYLSSRNSEVLSDLDIYPEDASNPDGNYNFYIVANVFRSVYGGGPGLASFSLSGSTNADGSMSWNCVPYNGGNSNVIMPLQVLPLYCRG